MPQQFRLIKEITEKQNNPVLPTILVLVPQAYSPKHFGLL